jgi:LysM repeat protein
LGKFISNEEEIYAMLRKQAEEQKLITQTNIKEVQISHLIRKGDNLKSVAKKYGVTVADLKTWNLIGKKGLRPGRRLVIYKAEKPEVADVKKPETVETTTVTPATEIKQLTENHLPLKPKVYVVRKGDTFYKIALDFGIPVNDLLEINGLKKGAGLQVGQKLKLAK